MEARLIPHGDLGLLRMLAHFLDLVINFVDILEVVHHVGGGNDVRLLLGRRR